MPRVYRRTHKRPHSRRAAGTINTGPLPVSAVFDEFGFPDPNVEINYDESVELVGALNPAQWFVMDGGSTWGALSGSVSPATTLTVVLEAAGPQTQADGLYYISAPTDLRASDTKESAQEISAYPVEIA